MILWLKNLVGITNLANDLLLYLYRSQKSFMDEQFATTTLIILQSNESLLIKNKQFNSFIQFRSITSSKNKYDFTRNYVIGSINRNFYTEKHSLNSTLKLTFHSDLFEFQMKSRNRYRIVESFLNLFILIVFWFKVDFITLPISFKNSVPFLKFLLLTFLYYVVSLLIFVFDLIFFFIKFLNFRR